MTENLPLILGSSYLEKNPSQPEKALEVLDEALANYPNGRFKGLLSVQRATALQQLGRLDEAAKLYTAYLSDNPDPAFAPQASLGLAFVLNNDGKKQEALEAFRKVRTDYPEAAEVETAHYHSGLLLLELQKPDEGVAEFESFRIAFPESPMLPGAIFLLGQVAASKSENEKALALYAELQDKFKDAKETTGAYFQRAMIFQKEGKMDQFVAELDRFIATYPESDRVHSAFKAKADIAASNSDIPGAIAIHESFMEKYSSQPQAAISLLEISNLRYQQVRTAGRYLALNEEGRANWKTLSDAGIASAEKVLKDFPDTNQVTPALQNLVNYQTMLLESNIIDPKGREKYFDDLAASLSANKALADKIAFTGALLVLDADKVGGVAKLEAVYSADALYSPAELDIYGTALLNEDKVDAAEKVFQKLASDYPNRPGVEPTKETRTIQEAQAISLFGLGMVDQKRGSKDQMLAKFSKLKELYPWSAKMKEANIFLAQDLLAAGKPQEAIDLIQKLLSDSKVDIRVRAQAMMINADGLKALNKTDAAMDTYIKIALYCPAAKEEAARGLWEGALLQEAKARGMKGDKDKKAQETMFLKARKTFGELVQKYPDSPHVAEAKKKLATLPGGKK